MRKLGSILALCALGTAMAVGCGDDDDGGGGGTGGSKTGGSAGAETGGSAGAETGGTGGGGGTAAEGVCGISCTTATEDDDCGADTAFAENTCVDGFCATTVKDCDDQAGDTQNCDIGGLGLSKCVEVDGKVACQTLCDPEDTVDLCAVANGECTGMGTGDDADVTFCVYPTPEPTCLGGVDVGEPCAQDLGLGGGGGQGGASSFGICQADGTCTCTGDSQCTAEGYACNTEPQ